MNLHPHDLLPVALFYFFKNLTCVAPGSPTERVLSQDSNSVEINNEINKQGLQTNKQTLMLVVGGWCRSAVC